MLTARQVNLKLEMSSLGISKESIKAKIYAIIIHVAENDGKTSSITTKNIRGYHFSEIRVKVSRDLYRIIEYFILFGEMRSWFYCICL